MAADYSMTAELLASHGIASTVSEIHGVLCGQVCTGIATVDIDLSCVLLEIEEDVEEVITNLLKLLAEDAKTQLKAQDFAFHPMLPDDEQALSTRLSALAHWCDGFNAGFAGAWIKDDLSIPEETREVLDDFSRIAQVDHEDEELSSKENEVNLMELVEYVRMAAITIYLQNSPELENSLELEDSPELENSPEQDTFIDPDAFPEDFDIH